MVHSGGLGPKPGRVAPGPEPMVPVPWDPAIATMDKPLEIGRLRRRTRLAYLRLAAYCGG
jgi:hypothetical protein